MNIEVKLFGVLRRYRPDSAGGAPHHPFSVMVTPGTTVDMLLEQLAVGDDLVSATAVNNESVDPTTILQTGDKVSIFPPTAGG